MLLKFLNVRFKAVKTRQVTGLTIYLSGPPLFSRPSLTSSLPVAPDRTLIGSGYCCSDTNQAPTYSAQPLCWFCPVATQGIATNNPSATNLWRHNNAKSIGRAGTRGAGPARQTLLCTFSGHILRKWTRKLFLAAAPLSNSHRKEQGSAINIASRSNNTSKTKTYWQPDKMDFCVTRDPRDSRVISRYQENPAAVQGKWTDPLKENTVYSDNSMVQAITYYFPGPLLPIVMHNHLLCYSNWLSKINAD